MVKNDAYSNASLAFSLLQQANPTSTILISKINQTCREFQERQRRVENRRNAGLIYHLTSKPGVLMDKSKMEQLEHVKQQLKKSIRLLVIETCFVFQKKEVAAHMLFEGDFLFN